MKTLNSELGNFHEFEVLLVNNNNRKNTEVEFTCAKFR